MKKKCTRKQRIEKVVKAFERLVKQAYTEKRPNFLKTLYQASMLEKNPSPKQILDIFGSRIVDLPKDQSLALMTILHNMPLRKFFDLVLDAFDRDGVEGVFEILSQVNLATHS